jgi:16S rRNA (guanine527-N7)-methyltransferase
MSIQLPALLEQWQESTGWQPTTAQLQQFQQFYDLVTMANHSLNLTRIIKPEAFWEKHLWDSLQPIVTNDLAGAMIDLGTGGGFPGIPIAICRPDWAVTVVDSTAKKINFIQSSLASLQLNNVQALVGRAETLNQDHAHRQKYQLVTVRAVANAVICAGYALPFLALGGTAILYRGQWTVPEKVDLGQAAKRWGGEISEVKAFQTPLTAGIRHCIYLRKVSNTPGLITKNTAR